MNFYNAYLRPLFFARRFYWLLASIIFCFVLSYFISWVYWPAQVLLIIFVLLLVLDYVSLFRYKQALTAGRLLPERFSNGDDNEVIIQLQNSYFFAVRVQLIDELPVQFQQRHFMISIELAAGESKSLTYSLRPVERGEYTFNFLRVFVMTPLQLLQRRFTLGEQQTVKVYPSFLHLKQFELLAHAGNWQEAGSRKMRKIGHSLEFEQIKEYVPGDDIRTVNWKATARSRGELMVNTYTDERSQQVYCLLDKGRTMKMPFEGMTLLDYAINASLVLARVTLLKQDRAGIIGFDHENIRFLPADRKAGQMTRILDTLYNQQTNFLESDYEKLFGLVKSRINQRSLLILFTNFESLAALKRQLPYLRALAKMHLLLVIFFENTELSTLTTQQVDTVEDLYTRVIAEKFVYEKRLIVKELQQLGIASLLTTPQNLSVNTVNKYLELKARQAI